MLKLRIFIGCCLWLCTLPDFCNAEQQQPNIIFIYTDDQRFDALGANGNSVIQTPALDKLARKGIRFTNAHVVFSLCSPSRAALLTGRYGSANGVLQLGSDLNPNEKTAAQFLQESGYATAMSGKWHLGRTPEDAGFDFSVWFEGNGTYYGRTIYDLNEKVNPEEHCDLYCAKRSADFMKEAVEGNKPFFLFHNTQLPHMNGVHEWDARPETLNRYRESDMPVPSSHLDTLFGKPPYLKNIRNLSQAKKYGYPEKSAIQKHTKEYYAVITEMDAFLDIIFKTVDQLGIRENTYIFFMSDNGWMLGEHGFTSKVLPYRPSTHVPLIIVGPGLAPGTEDRIVLNIDMMPTLLEISGIQKPENVHGTSLMPLMHNKKTKWRNSFVYEGLGTYGGAEPNLTAIRENLKYIVTYSNIDLKEESFTELYNFNSDPDERFNIADNKHYTKEVRRLKKVIKNHQVSVLSKPGGSKP
ncbi:MAG: sulfatase-like hydrolase/transferase [Cyclobacteriaceae bacterium]|nr:sulfatase-like hydrolase/transferase [Cyclobacteriaceae bacterium]